MVLADLNVKVFAENNNGFSPAVTLQLLHPDTKISLAISGSDTLSTANDTITISAAIQNPSATCV
jgi:hypothetical protein